MVTTTLSPRVQFEGALVYCNGLRIGGFDDWRLPTLKEAQVLIRDWREAGFDSPLRMLYSHGFSFWENTVLQQWVTQFGSEWLEEIAQALDASEQASLAEQTPSQASQSKQGLRKLVEKLEPHFPAETLDWLTGVNSYALLDGAAERIWTKPLADGNVVQQWLEWGIERDRANTDPDVTHDRQEVVGRYRLGRTLAVRSLSKQEVDAEQQRTSAFS